MITERKHTTGDVRHLLYAEEVKVPYECTHCGWRDTDFYIPPGLSVEWKCPVCGLVHGVRG